MLQARVAVPDILLLQTLLHQKLRLVKETSWFNDGDTMWVKLVADTPVLEVIRPTDLQASIMVSLSVSVPVLIMGTRIPQEKNNQVFSSAQNKKIL